MAQKEVVIKAKLDTEDSISNVEQLKRNLRNIDVSDANKSMKQLNELIDKGGLSVREIQQAIKKYQSIAIEAGQTSPIGQEALKRAGELKDRIADAQHQIRAMAQDGKVMNASITITSTALQGYQAFTGLAQLAGGENRKLVETMSKMMVIQQSLTAVEQVANQFRKGSVLTTYAMATAYKVLGVSAETASTGTRNFAKALAATGIGAILVLLGLLIANFKDIVSWIQNLWGKIQNLTRDIPVLSSVIKGLTAAFDAVGNAIQWVKELFGGMTREQETFLKMQQKVIDSTEQMADYYERQYNRMISIEKAYGRDTYALEKEKTEKMIVEYQKRLTAYDEMLKNQKQIDGKYNENTLKERQELIEKIKDLLTELKIKEIEHNKEITEKAKQYIEEQRIARERASLRISEDLKLRAVELEQLANQIADTTMLPIRRTQEELSMFDVMFSETSKKAIETYMSNIMTAQQRTEVMVAAYGNMVGAMGNVFDALAQLSEQNNKKNKALALASIVSNQAQSIAFATLAATKAAADAKPPILAPIIWGTTYASILAGIISSIAKAKNILGTSGGGEGGNVQMPRVGSNAPTGAQAEQMTNYAGNNTGNNNETQPVKVFVLETDITKAQKDKEYNQKIAIL